MPTLTTFMTFDSQAEEAANLYLSIFEEGKITSIQRAGDKVFGLTLELLGRTLFFMNGGPSFTFSQAFSLFVACDTQAEIDRYWGKLTDNGGKEVQCGWLVDRFGVSWQIVPRIMTDLLGSKDPVKSGRTMQAMMKMVKLDIAALKRAHDGEA